MYLHIYLLSVVGADHIQEISEIPSCYKFCGLTRSKTRAHIVVVIIIDADIDKDDWCWICDVLAVEFVTCWLLNLWRVGCSFLWARNGETLSDTRRHCPPYLSSENLSEFHVFLHAVCQIYKGEVPSLVCLSWYRFSTLKVVELIWFQFVTIHYKHNSAWKWNLILYFFFSRAHRWSICACNENRYFIETTNSYVFDLWACNQI
jgi:hypothetical protein